MPESSPDSRSRRVDPQSVGGGLILLAIAAFALWAMRSLDSGTLGSLGSGGLPRAAAILLAVAGVAVLARGLLSAGPRITAFSLRGPLVLLIAIAAFALTIKPMPIGGFTAPGLGLIVAGPLCVFIAGWATPEARWGELAILALALTAFCMVLFGDLLALPIPVFPVALMSRFPDGWSHVTILRVLAASLCVAAALLFIALRRSSPARAATGKEGLQ